VKVVEVDGTRMSRNNIGDQLICRIWLTRLPLWTFMATSTYAILLTALERYAAVVHHVWYYNNVRSVSMVYPQLIKISLSFSTVK